jgi:hypothetical protein
VVASQGAGAARVCDVARLRHAGVHRLIRAGNNAACAVVAFQRFSVGEEKLERVMRFELTTFTLAR